MINVAFAIPSYKSWDICERTQFLLATSLVSRDWTYWAQRELNRPITVYEREGRVALAALAAAGPGEYPVRSLTLDRPDSSDRALLNVRGIKELFIWWGCIIWDHLCGDNLKGTRNTVAS